nr:unnamed protein product [Digitaria exilis]
MGSDFDGDEERNGSKAVTLLLRLSTMALALTSAVVMATASECTIYEPHGARITVTFKHFPLGTCYLYIHGSILIMNVRSYLTGFNVAATILEAIGIYLQVGKGVEDEELLPKLAKILLVIVDVLVPALLNLATGAAFSAVVAYGPQISACAATAGRFCEQVHRSKLFSLAASISAVVSAATKDVPLPFSVWPVSSDDC